METKTKCNICKNEIPYEAADRAVLEVKGKISNSTLEFKMEFCIKCLTQKILPLTVRSRHKTRWRYETLP